MANVFLGFPNWVDAEAQYATVSFSGGSWQAALPLTNLRDEELVNVARSVGATTASTTLTVDLGKPRRIRGLFVPKHNVGRDGQVKWTLSSDSGFTLIQYETAWKDAWPVVYPFGSLQFGHESFWTGKLTVEGADGISPPLIDVISSEVVARYIKLEINDTTNSDGYIELARLCVCGGWQPTVNMLYGAGLGFETQTSSEISLGGARFFDVQPVGRTVSFEMDALTDDESMTWVYELTKQLSLNKQFMFVWDPDDTVHLHRRSFLARLTRLTEIKKLYFSTSGAAFSASEVL